MTIQVLGIDLGKSCFHVVSHDECGKQIARKKFTRPKLLAFLSQHPTCTVAFEACCGAHWLGRKCQRYGHEVKLLPPQYVKPYVKTNKNDFIDADAIAEAATRPSMRFVSVRSENAQVISALHRCRSGYIKDRTEWMSRIGALLLEFGIALPQGHAAMKTLFEKLAVEGETLPKLLITELHHCHKHYTALNNRIADLDKTLKALVESDARGNNLKSIPGVGDVTASLCLAHVSAAGDFKNGRNFAAWIGLVPRQFSTGGKTNLLGISKRGNKALRTAFIHGARAILSKPEKTGAVFGEWLVRLRAEKPFNVALVALANKLARIAWSVMQRGECFAPEKV